MRLARRLSGERASCHALHALPARWRTMPAARRSSLRLVAEVRPLARRGLPRSPTPPPAGSRCWWPGIVPAATKKDRQPPGPVVVPEHPHGRRQHRVGENDKQHQRRPAGCGQHRCHRPAPGRGDRHTASHGATPSCDGAVLPVAASAALPEDPESLTALAVSPRFMALSHKG